LEVRVATRYLWGTTSVGLISHPLAANGAEA
jgi:hypothetical protein